MNARVYLLFAVTAILALSACAGPKTQAPSEAPSPTLPLPTNTPLPTATLTPAPTATATALPTLTLTPTYTVTPFPGLANVSSSIRHGLPVRPPISIL